MVNRLEAPKGLTFSYAGLWCTNLHSALVAPPTFSWPDSGSPCMRGKSQTILVIQLWVKAGLVVIVNEIINTINNEQQLAVFII